ncbi:phage protein NinX family protein [Providencia alcalifaciens]|uniref:phage protein NinX family protein n=1 Tax=Providencia alcalifaciens TaxID=126385 RepID=UPI002B061DDD|nr:phage protein NinX family protein [Providencia alcalifaciens]
MNKYTELSDFEINKKVALHVGGFALSLTVVDDGYKTEGNIGNFDPCNSPSDAIPIIIANKIAIFPMETLGCEYWCAACNFQDIGEKEIVWGLEANNKNPLRAAMELFLLMKDAENERV